jgi:cellobiose phosphorylase
VARLVPRHRAERVRPICERRGRTDLAQAYRDEARWLTGMLELAWDGDWYRRAYFDDGTPLGSVQNEECKLDSLTQSWAVLSQAAQPRRAERAMDAVRAHLVRRDAQVVLLLTPPFDRMAHDPGYIKGYVPGVRENGGQYTHAALWTVIALARLGMGDEAMELFHMINPINHMRRWRTPSATGWSRTPWRPTSTRTRCTSAGAGGRGTPGRRDGCTRRRSGRSSGSSGAVRRSA